MNARNIATLLGLIVFGLAGMLGAVEYGSLVRDGILKSHGHITISTATAISIVPVVIISGIVIAIVIVLAMRMYLPAQSKS